MLLAETEKEKWKWKLENSGSIVIMSYNYGWKLFIDVIVETLWFSTCREN